MSLTLESPRLHELNHLYEKLSPEQRDERLQGLLIAAPRGGEAMIKVLEDELLCHAVDEMVEEHRSAGSAKAKDLHTWGVDGSLP